MDDVFEICAEQRLSDALAGPAGASSRTAAGDDSTEMSLQDINNYKESDPDADAGAGGAGAGALESSPEAVALGLSRLDAVFVKVMERKMEVMQWDMHQMLQRCDDNVIVNVTNKKDLLRVQVPVKEKLRLPFAGTITTANTKGSHHFATVFGLDFYVQGRSDALNADVVVAAWSAKTVSKVTECNFQHETHDLEFIAWLAPGGSPLSVSLMTGSPEEMSEKASEVVSGGGNVCALAAFSGPFFFR